jgi:ABC-2 type transport system permease protein
VAGNWVRYATAARMASVEQLRSRFALGLLVLVIPVCVVMPYFGYAEDPTTFRLVVTDDVVRARGNELGMVVTVFNGVTLLVGFMIFSSARSSVDFDHRVAMAGYPRAWLVAAKLSVLVVVSGVLTAYAMLVVRLVWQPAHPRALALCLFAAALTYGVIGLFVGVVMRGELEGMFLIIGTSIVDQALQNPVLNPVLEEGIRPYLPSYGATQSGIAAGFAPGSPGVLLGTQSLWFVATAACALFALSLRTRDRRGAKRPVHRTIDDAAEVSAVRRTG